jgi:hypothetical protein
MWPVQSKKEVFAFLSLLSRYNEFQEFNKKLTRQEQRTLKDQLVYRLMFDKKRSDDTTTDEMLAIIPKEVK